MKNEERTMRRIIFASVLMLLMPFSVMADGVIANVDNEQVPYGEALRYTITYDGDSSNLAEPDFEVLEKDFQIYSSSTSMQSSYINGKSQHKKNWHLTLLPKHKGKITIPEIKVGKFSTVEINIDVTDENYNNNKIKGREEAAPQKINSYAQLKLNNDSVYVGQEINAVLEVYDRHKMQFSGMPEVENALDWDIKVLQEPTIEKKDDENIIRFYYAMFPKKSGKLQTPVMRVNGTYTKRDFSNNTMQGRFRNMSNTFGLGGYDLFDMFFVTPQPISFASESKDIEVKAVPAEYGNINWLPATALTISAQWGEKNQQFKVGETAVREITITASGVLAEQLPEPSFGTNEAWKQYPETPQLNSIVHDSEMISQAVIRVVYIPQKGGEYTLPEIKVPWFNVKTGKAEIAVVKSEDVVVKGEDIETAVIKENEQNTAENKINTTISQPQNFSETKTAKTEENKWLWLALVVGAFAIGGMLSYAVFGRNSSRIAATAASKTESLKDIEKYLKLGDYRTLRNTLIAFGNKESSGFAVNNLNDLAKLVNQADFTAQMELLNGILYAGKQTNLDDEIIIKSLKNMHKNNATASTSKPLPELYK